VEVLGTVRFLIRELAAVSFPIRASVCSAISAERLFSCWSGVSHRDYYYHCERMMSRLPLVCSRLGCALPRFRAETWVGRAKRRKQGNIVLDSLPADYSPIPVTGVLGKVLSASVCRWSPHPASSARGHAHLTPPRLKVTVRKMRLSSRGCRAAPHAPQPEDRDVWEWARGVHEGVRLAGPVRRGAWG
jgi:hypothetical protein